MSKYQKLAILFVFLGIAFLAGGIALNQFVEYAITFGLALAAFCQVVSLVFALLWYLSTKKK